MFDIVICELKKFKGQWIFLIIGAFLLVNGSSSSLNSDTIINADQLYTWINLGVFSYGFLATVNIMTAIMFIQEFKDNTMSSMVIYRHERWKIFVGKIMAIILVSLILYILEFIMLTIFSYLSFKDTLTSAVIIKHLVLTAKAFFFQMLMITVTASIALVSKKIIVPLMYIGGQLVISLMYLFNPMLRKVIPFPLPVVSNLMIIKDDYVFLKDISIIPSAVIIAIIMFIGGLLYGCWYIEKMEIQ
ncbi:ABC transporter permease [Clostridium sediminicola]|uniref:ABC transporter permease n=1 Tax=Clostridium sediminicola TaxID=3114879 RepID=UPI0031F20CFB